MSYPSADAPDPPGEQQSAAATGPDRQTLLTMLTTEHFTLQGARANTVSESTARAALYVGSLSASLVALGLLAQATQLGTAFDAFVLIVLPTLYVVGTFTFVRLAESSVEDLTYGRAINRIRGYYRDVAGEQAPLLRARRPRRRRWGAGEHGHCPAVALAAVLHAGDHDRGAERRGRRQRDRVRCRPSRPAAGRSLRRGRGHRDRVSRREPTLAAAPPRSGRRAGQRAVPFAALTAGEGPLPAGLMLWAQAQHGVVRPPARHCAPGVEQL
jgi:hypothetical protein